MKHRIIICQEMVNIFLSFFPLVFRFFFCFLTSRSCSDFPPAFRLPTCVPTSRSCSNFPIVFQLPACVPTSRSRSFFLSNVCEEVKSFGTSYLLNKTVILCLMHDIALLTYFSFSLLIWIDFHSFSQNRDGWRCKDAIFKLSMPITFTKLKITIFLVFYKSVTDGPTDGRMDRPSHRN